MLGIVQSKVHGLSVSLLNTRVLFVALLGSSELRYRPLEVVGTQHTSLRKWRYQYPYRLGDAAMYCEVLDLLCRRICSYRKTERVFRMAESNCRRSRLQELYRVSQVVLAFGEAYLTDMFHGAE